METVAVCDTEPIAIEGLRSLLESDESLRVIATENSLEEGMDAVRELQPSILLIDKLFGTHSIMDCPKTFRALGIRTSVIVWGSAFPEAESLRFLQAGASGVIRKSAPLDALLTCLRQVARGDTWTEENQRREPNPSGRHHSPLTARELQVMDLVERGMKNKEIAAALGICTGTVKIHLKHIFEKTGIRGRYGLALSGLKEKGLLVPALVEV